MRRLTCCELCEFLLLAATAPNRRVNLGSWPRTQAILADRFAHYLGCFLPRTLRAYRSGVHLVRVQVPSHKYSERALARGLKSTTLNAPDLTGAKIRCIGSPRQKDAHKIPSAQQGYKKGHLLDPWSPASGSLGLTKHEMFNG